MNKKVFELMKTLLDRTNKLEKFVGRTDGSRTKFKPFFNSLAVWDTEDYQVESLNGNIMFTKEPPKFYPLSARIEVRMGHPVKGGSVEYGNFNIPKNLDLVESQKLFERSYTNVFWECAEDYEKRFSKIIGSRKENSRDDYLYHSKEKKIKNHVLEKNLDFDYESVLKDIDFVSKKIHRDWLERSSVCFSAIKINTYIINSEGSEIFNSGVLYKYFIQADALENREILLPHVVKNRLVEPPTRKELLSAGYKAVEELEQILKSPVQTNGSYPTIMCGDNTGVVFHEAIGHGLEGHRAQKNYDETNLFKDRLGEQITKNFVNIYDDPTLKEFNGTKLDCNYEYDEDGVKAQKVLLVENGVLKNYLHSRQSAGYFNVKSNGHARADVHNNPSPRMGNLIIESANGVSYDSLKQLLIKEVKKQRKKYGLMFVDADSGWVNTEEAIYNSYPANVFRVYTNGDVERVHGIHIVGSPDDALTNILAMSNKYTVRNGECGAESGFIPHATIAPYTLFRNITINRIPRDAFPQAKDNLFRT